MSATEEMTSRSRRRRWVLPVAVVGVVIITAAACRPMRPPRTTTTSMDTTPTSGDPTTPTSGQPGGGTLPPVTSTDVNGPFAVTVDPNGGTGTYVFRPTQMGQGGVKHPIFVWGTGATSTPSQYRDHFTRMASHGIVVISPNTGSVTAARLNQAKTWIVQQNSVAGPYQGNLDTSNIAMGGHSLGSVQTFIAEENARDLKTTIHIAGGSFDGRGSSRVRTPTAYMCGSTDFALTNCQRDYQAMQAGGPPLYFATMTGVDHIQAARRALPAMIAWLRWHLAGEVDRKAQFTSPNGIFTQGIFRAQHKNWN
jgi:hypothetical protein